MPIDSYKKLIEDIKLKNLHIVLTALLAEFAQLGY
jgi:hypothetical protein